MSPRDDLEKIHNSDLSASYIALKRAAKIAREVAIQTNTSVVIMQEGKIVHLTSQELKKNLS